MPGAPLLAFEKWESILSPRLCRKLPPLVAQWLRETSTHSCDPKENMRNITVSTNDQTYHVSVSGDAQRERGPQGQVFVRGVLIHRCPASSGHSSKTRPGSSTLAATPGSPRTGLRPGGGCCPTLHRPIYPSELREPRVTPPPFFFFRLCNCEALRKSFGIIGLQEYLAHFHSHCNSQ